MRAKPGVSPGNARPQDPAGRAQTRASRYNAVMPRVRRYTSLPYEERAEKRAEAQKLLTAGVPGAAVARLIGATKAAVSVWKIALEQQGPKALTGVPKPGRKQALTDAQIDLLIKLLKKHPSKYGLELRNDAWTWDGITQLVRSELHIECVRQTVQRALRRKGWELS